MAHLYHLLNLLNDHHRPPCCLNKIIMIQNAKNHSLPMQPQPHRNQPQPSVHNQSQDLLYQSDHQLKSELFRIRFKNNQHSLKSKFKKYLKDHQSVLPRRRYKLQDHVMTQEAESVVNIRRIRKEKMDIMEELNHSMNESHYYLHRNQEYEKTCHLLAKRVVKVEGLRREKKSELAKMEQTLRSISKEIREEKERLRQKVVNDKGNLEKSRIESQRRKVSLARSVRVEREFHSERISEQKLMAYKEKLKKCQTVREEQENVGLNVSRCYEEKKSKAKELKLDKLFREISQKQMVKSKYQEVKKFSSNKIPKCKNKTIALQQKIKEFRKSLGERRLDPPARSTNYNFRQKRSLTQTHQFSSNGQLIDRIKQNDMLEQQY